ncbi:sister chromatid cohesion 1 protein 1 [Selaginella moellendorffii]|uniref:sister chromatid cohesion 1 protein 1 n=1 Tax=Selaginella moellendorffii TaxID=88036 RepID=UPI000D1C7156|nr:sister chromatid cohesion 1 protein 1 [Selaginella moellendorffii]|eukprot:XP_024535257.1 sister chromatid cohesion 1 protein 1 [Selaginella moellendorffii]
MLRLPRSARNAVKIGKPGSAASDDPVPSGPPAGQNIFGLSPNKPSRMADRGDGASKDEQEEDRSDRHPRELFKMKTKQAALKTEDTTRLPQRRARAKFEAITIDGTEETFQDFERAMLEPETPDQDDPEFFTVPPPVARTRPNRFQADNEDITLNEDSVRSFATVLDDDVEREESEYRFQQPENFIDDMITMNAPLQVPNGLEPISEERDGDNEKGEDKGPKSPEPHKPRKKRKTIKRQKKLVYDVELTEIPAQVFQSWLQDTSNIIYRRNRRKLYTQASAERAKVMLNNPLTFLGCGTIPKSLLPASIVDLWSKATVVTPRNEQQKTTSEQQKQQEQQTSAKQQDQQVSADQSVALQ